ELMNLYIPHALQPPGELRDQHLPSWNGFELRRSRGLHLAEVGLEVLVGGHTGHHLREHRRLERPREHTRACPLSRHRRRRGVRPGPEPTWPRSTADRIPRARRHTHAMNSDGATSNLHWPAIQRVSAIACSNEDAEAASRRSKYLGSGA